MKKAWLRSLAATAICSVITSLITGIIENKLTSILEVRYYGHPLVWRVTYFLQQPPTNEFIFSNFVIDAAFWFVVTLLALLILTKTLRKNLST